MTECALVVQNYWMQKSEVDAEEEKGVVVEDDPLCWMCAALDLTTLSGKNSVSLPCWFSYHHLLVFFCFFRARAVSRYATSSGPRPFHSFRVDWSGPLSY